MTGRDLIIYILQNNLEDTKVFEDGRPLGLMSIEEAAVKFNVGIGTIRLWIVTNRLPHIQIGYNAYIPANAEPELDDIRTTEA